MPSDLSETAKVRDEIIEYCVVEGIELACGREKICDSVIGIDFALQYNQFYKTAADYTKGWEQFFIENPDKQWDYIFSSHLLEDYPDAYRVMMSWCKFIKDDGYLILYLPIEQVYRSIGSNLNSAHSNDWKGAEDFITGWNEWSKNKRLKYTLEPVKTSIGKEPFFDYSFYVVMKKINLT